MVRHRALGEWIRRRREAAGLHSASALAVKSGLSINYISIVERGERLPRWESAERIARGLGLDADAREEFFRLVDSAGKPRTVQSATTTFPIGGLVVWRHLPSLVYAVGHREGVHRYTDPDQTLPDVVRSTASLLAWAAVVRRPPSKKQQDMLLRLLLRTWEQVDFGPTPRAANFNIPAVIPQLWREMLFTDRESTESLVKLLSWWEYSPAGWLDRPAMLTFRLSDPRLQQRCGVLAIEPNEVIGLHDGLIFGRLFSMLATAESPDDAPSDMQLRVPAGPRGFLSFPGPSIEKHITRTALKRRLGELVAPSDEAVRKDIVADESPGLVKRRDWQDLANYGRFAARLFDEPFTAALVYPEVWEVMRDRVSTRCELVESLLNQHPPHPAHRLPDSGPDQAGKEPPQPPIGQP